MVISGNGPSSVIFVVCIAVMIGGSIGLCVEAQNERAIETLVNSETVEIVVCSDWGIDRCLQKAGWTSDTKFTLAQRRDAVRKINKLSLAKPLQVEQTLKIPIPQ